MTEDMREYLMTVASLLATAPESDDAVPDTLRYVREQGLDVEVES